MNGTIAYALARKYVDKTADTLGSLKGAPCTVKDVTTVDGETTITLEWEGTSGATETTQFVVSDGDSAYEIACDNGFVGTEEEWLNSLKGVEGKDGASPTITTTRNATDDGVDITITNPDGTTSTTTVYDGKGNDAQYEVVDETLFFKSSSSATVIDETLMM